MNKITGEHQTLLEEMFTKKISIHSVHVCTVPTWPMLLLFHMHKLVPLTCTLPFHTAVMRKVVPQKYISISDIVKSCYGYWWLKVSCLMLRGVSAWQKETALTRLLMLPSPSCWNTVNLNQVTINYHFNHHCGIYFNFVGQPLSKQVYT